MTVIISGSSGITNVNGSAAAPAETGVDTDTGIFFPAANTLGFSTNSAEVARFDSSGNLGLGVTPSAWNSSYKAFQIADVGVLAHDSVNAGHISLGSNYYRDSTPTWRYISSASATRYTQYVGEHQWFTTASGTAGNAITWTQAMTLDASGRLGIGTTSPAQIVEAVNSTSSYFRSRSTASAFTGVDFGQTTSGAGIIDVRDAQPLIFYTADTERARIDSSGNLLVGTTTVTGIGAGYNSVNVAGSSGGGVVFKDAGATRLSYVYGDSTNRLYCIQNTNGVYLANAGTSWTSASDERVKDIIEPIENATQKLSGWRTVIGKYKTDEEGARRSFLIAQDVLETFPEAVDTSNPDEYGLSYQDTIPVLVKAIQEQQQIITQLQADIEILKAKA